MRTPARLTSVLAVLLLAGACGDVGYTGTGESLSGNQEARKAAPMPDGTGGVAGTGNCGDIDYFGSCDGDTLVYCNGGTRVEVRCGDHAQLCDWENDEVGHNCIDDGDGGGGSSTGGGGGGGEPQQGSWDGECRSYSDDEVANVLRVTGFPEWSISEMVRIAHCESQMNNCVTNWYNWIGTTDWGLFQINEIWIPGDRYALYDPWLNAEYALMVFEQQGLGAWVCHNL